MSQTLNFENTNKEVPNLLSLGIQHAMPALLIGAAIAISFNSTIRYAAENGSIVGAPWNKASIIGAGLTLREVNNAVANDDYSILGLLGAAPYTKVAGEDRYYIADGDGAPISMLNILSATAAMIAVLYFYHKSKVNRDLDDSHSSLSSIKY